MTPTRRVWLVLDAKAACLRLLVERRTKGRFELYTAISDLYSWLNAHRKAPE